MQALPEYAEICNSKNPQNLAEQGCGIDPVIAEILDADGIKPFKTMSEESYYVVFTDASETMPVSISDKEFEFTFHPIIFQIAS